MKTPIAVTLIIMGSLLVMTPAIADYLYQLNSVELLSKLGLTGVNVNLAGRMEWDRSYYYWLGTGMVIAALYYSEKKSTT